MQKSSCTPNIVKNSLEMLIYFRVNSAFSLPNFMTYGASLWDTIRLLHLPPNCEVFCSASRADRRIVNDVTVIATQKLDENPLQIGKPRWVNYFLWGILSIISNITYDSSRSRKQEQVTH
uniref:Uncharacterized protein n=1 Tax=Candidatus Kentrum sp. FM TaxID=2126340 RepID=A0A450SKI9_9GAMM|nr:MAG: hypothetical protein BECKFM1743A_GA0114220_101244 [Candidatus Kentron sp. FM]